VARGSADEALRALVASAGSGSVAPSVWDALAAALPAHDPAAGAGDGAVLRKRPYRIVLGAWACAVGELCRGPVGPEDGTWAAALARAAAFLLSPHCASGPSAGGNPHLAFLPADMAVDAWCAAGGWVVATGAADPHACQALAVATACLVTMATRRSMAAKLASAWCAGKAVGGSWRGRGGARDRDAATGADGDEGAGGDDGGHDIGGMAADGAEGADVAVQAWLRRLLRHDGAGATHVGHLRMLAAVHATLHASNTAPLTHSLRHAVTTAVIPQLFNAAAPAVWFAAPPSLSGAVAGGQGWAVVQACLAVRDSSHDFASFLPALVAAAAAAFHQWEALGPVDVDMRRFDAVLVGTHTPAAVGTKRPRAAAADDTTAASKPGDAPPAIVGVVATALRLLDEAALADAPVASQLTALTASGAVLSLAADGDAAPVQVVWGGKKPPQAVVPHLWQRYHSCMEAATPAVAAAVMAGASCGHALLLASIAVQPAWDALPDGVRALRSLARACTGDAVGGVAAVAAMAGQLAAFASQARAVEAFLPALTTLLLGSDSAATAASLCRIIAHPVFTAHLGPAIRYMPPASLLGVVDAMAARAPAVAAALAADDAPRSDGAPGWQATSILLLLHEAVRQVEVTPSTASRFASLVLRPTATSLRTIAGRLTGRSLPQLWTAWCLCSTAVVDAAAKIRATLPVGAAHDLVSAATVSPLPETVAAGASAFNEWLLTHALPALSHGRILLPLLVALSRCDVVAASGDMAVSHAVATALAARCVAADWTTTAWVASLLQAVGPANCPAVAAGAVSAILQPAAVVHAEAAVRACAGAAAAVGYGPAMVRSLALCLTAALAVVTGSTAGGGRGGGISAAAAAHLVRALTVLAVHPAAHSAGVAAAIAVAAATAAHVACAHPAVALFAGQLAGAVAAMDGGVPQAPAVMHAAVSALMSAPSTQGSGVALLRHAMRAAPTSVPPVLARPAVTPAFAAACDAGVPDFAASGGALAAEVAATATSPVSGANCGGSRAAVWQAAGALIRQDAAASGRGGGAVTDVLLRAGMACRHFCAACAPAAAASFFPALHTCFSAPRRVTASKEAAAPSSATPPAWASHDVTLLAARVAVALPAASTHACHQPDYLAPLLTYSGRVPALPASACTPLSAAVLVALRRQVATLLSTHAMGDAGNRKALTTSLRSTVATVLSTILYRLSSASDALVPGASAVAADGHAMVHPDECLAFITHVLSAPTLFPATTGALDAACAVMHRRMVMSGAPVTVHSVSACLMAVRTIAAHHADAAPLLLPVLVQVMLAAVANLPRLLPRLDHTLASSLTEAAAGCAESLVRHLRTSSVLTAQVIASVARLHAHLPLHAAASVPRALALTLFAALDAAGDSDLQLAYLYLSPDAAARTDLKSLHARYVADYRFRGKV